MGGYARTKTLTTPGATAVVVGSAACGRGDTLEGTRLSLHFVLFHATGCRHTEQGGAPAGLNRFSGRLPRRSRIER
jgi:hypothetical protein